MAIETGIGWCDHTLNFWWGCHRVSTECRDCYIEGIMKRAGKSPFNGPIRTSEATWNAAYRWNQAAAEAGERRTVFITSMSDFWHTGADKWRGEAYDLIRQCVSLDFLLLTKRVKRFAKCLPSDWGEGWPNVWLGTTCGHRSSLERVRTLIDVPAVCHWVSAEPLLSEIDFSPYIANIDWIITGCEQSKKGHRRLMDLDWVRSIDQQCEAANVAHFFKQYYQDDRGVPVTDGMLDDVKRQDFPRRHRHFKRRETVS